MPALIELERAYAQARRDPSFRKEFQHSLHQYAGRATPLYFAERLTQKLGGAKIYLKREDLCHTGAHKINNTLGQILLARKMGKERIIAETGAGQHGVATATVAARFGLECEIFMGKEDVARQSLNVFRMKLLGAKVRVVEAGSQTLKDAMNEALRDWVTHVRNTYYLIGSVAGPHPYPMMVRDFQSVIGKEARRQFLKAEGRLPDYLVACVGGGSNSMGLFYPFVRDPKVRMLGVEAAGRGLRTGKHAASILGGEVGVLHGSKSYVLQDESGQIRETLPDVALAPPNIRVTANYPGASAEAVEGSVATPIEQNGAADTPCRSGIRLASKTGSELRTSSRCTSSREQNPSARPSIDRPPATAIGRLQLPRAPASGATSRPRSNRHSQN